MKNLVHDLRHNHGLPTSVDNSPFKIGRTCAFARQVVFRNEMFELIQYTPTVDQVYKRPLVMCPPQVNKFYAVDLSPEKSLVKWAVGQRRADVHRELAQPDQAQRHWGLEHYALALDEAVDVARQITGSPDVNMWGACSGGMTLGGLPGLAGSDRARSGKVVNVIWAGVRARRAGDGGHDAGSVQLADELQGDQGALTRKGVVEGSEMARMFAWLRPNDLIWNYWVNNYLLGNKPPAFDILAWNADTTRLPASSMPTCSTSSRRTRTCMPARWRSLGVPIDMRQGGSRRLRDRRHHRPHHALEGVLRHGAHLRRRTRPSCWPMPGTCRA